jgi:predicted NBD/HSP70 family sugar kinase
MSDVSKQDCRKAAVRTQSAIDLSSKALIELVAAGDDEMKRQRATAISQLDQAITNLRGAKDLLEGQNDV